jgi:nicotinamide riboside transporter PnuC
MGRRKNKKKRVLSGKNPLELFVEIIILIILMPFFYNLSFLAFIGYLITIFAIVYNQKILRKKNIVRFVVFGCLLTYIAGLIIIYGLKQDELYVFLIIVSFGVFMWYKGNNMKKK